MNGESLFFFQFFGVCWMDGCCFGKKPVSCKLVLTEEDIPGASLPNDRDLKSFNVSVLKCWLDCRGPTRSGNEPELIAR